MKKYHLFLNSRVAKRGFTLLISVLVGSILIALGSAIFNLVSKEIILSSSGRESQFAFFAADTGIECALYWDIKHNAFVSESPLTDVACGGAPATLTRTAGHNGSSPTLTTTFTFSLNSGAANPCAAVTVLKTTVPTSTVIASQGYNTCITTNPLRLERAIRVQY